MGPTETELSALTETCAPIEYHKHPLEEMLTVVDCLRRKTFAEQAKKNTRKDHERVKIAGSYSNGKYSWEHERTLDCFQKKKNGESEPNPNWVIT